MTYKVGHIIQSNLYGHRKIISKFTKTSITTISFTTDFYGKPTVEEFAWKSYGSVLHSGYRVVGKLRESTIQKIRNLYGQV